MTPKLHSIVGSLALLVAAACGSSHSDSQPASETTSTSPAETREAESEAESATTRRTRPAVQLGPSGTLIGVVRLAEGAELPAWPTPPTEVANRELPAECSPPQDSDRFPITVDAQTGGLIGMPILIIGADASRWPRATEPTTRDLVIRNCRLEPAAIVATVGDNLRISNPSSYPFFPTYLGGRPTAGVTRGSPIDLELTAIGPSSVECALTAPCGRAEVITLAHPVHAVTDVHGRFEIHGVPADQEIQVHPWHPLFATTHMSLRVEADRETRIEVEVRPASDEDAGAEAQFDQPPTSTTGSVNAGSANAGSANAGSANVVE